MKHIQTNTLHFYVYVLIAKANADGLRQFLGSDFFHDLVMDHPIDFTIIDNAAAQVEAELERDNDLADVVRLAVVGFAAEQKTIGKTHDREYAWRIIEMRLREKSYTQIAQKLGVERDAIIKTVKRSEKRLHESLT